MADRRPPREHFEKEARARLVTGDLFSYPHPVITIQTGGRAYGALSRTVESRGVKIPSLALYEAAFVDPYILVALWNDTNVYASAGIAACAAACLRKAWRLGLAQLVLSVLGGKGGERFLADAEMGIFDESDRLDEARLPIPDHVYVTDKKFA